MNSPLDEEIVEQIRQLGGDKLLSDLVEIYVEQAPVRLREIERGLETGDLVRAAKGAHSFRSSSISLGARELAEQAARLERLADDDQAGKVQKGLGDFVKSVDELLAYLTSNFGGGS